MPQRVAKSLAPVAKHQAPFTRRCFMEKVVELLHRRIAGIKSVERIESAEGKIPSTSSAVSAPPKNLLSLASINIHNTSALATDKQHEPLKKWFQQHSITPQFDYARVDTSGFFDDAACAIGDNYKLFLEIVDDILCLLSQEREYAQSCGRRAQSKRNGNRYIIFVARYIRIHFLLIFAIRKKEKLFT